MEYYNLNRKDMVDTGMAGNNIQIQGVCVDNHWSALFCVLILHKTLNQYTVGIEGLGQGKVWW